MENISYLCRKKLKPNHDGTRTDRTTAAGTVQGLAIALAGGVILFAFNYGWLYLKYLHKDIFKPLFSIVFIILLIGIGIYVMRNKKD